ncbi:unnamed protein product, partial [Rotaria socialis]
MRIEKIPVTINGKLDTKALPEFNFAAEESNYCAPRNELEVKLCEIWSDILGIEKVGITDNFFQLGGDSIGSLQIVGRLRQDNDLNISVKDIFMYKTIEKLYDNKLKDQVMHLNADVESLNGIELSSSTGEIGLLWILEYFLKRKDFSSNHFNQHVIFRIALFDENKFRDCLVKLVAHHEAFRIRFKKGADAKYFPCYQTNLDSDQINLVRIKTLASTQMALETELRGLLKKTTDIENGPMYMVGYSYDHEDNGSAKVWIFIHDLIADWISCRIISEDLQRLYHGSSFSSSSFYKQWSIAVKEYVTNIETNEVAYWECFLNANVKHFNHVLTDKQRTNNGISETEIILPEQTVRSLLNDCNKIYNTEIEHLLLTALGYTLRDEITSLKENYATFECCGRDFVNNLDLNRSIGMFRTLYPVRLQLADDDMRTSIINVKEHMKQVPNKGIGFGAIMGNESNDFPLVSFNYLGSFENEHNENGNEDEWSLLDAHCGNSLDDNTKEVVKINSLIINKQMRVNIKTKMGTEITVQFGKAFQINIEKIIKHTQSVNRTYLTRSDVHYVIKNNDYLNRIQLDKEVDAIFLANSLQQGLLYHSLKQSNVDDAYIVQSILQYRTHIDQKMFKMAWEHAQKRFSTLRLRFDWQEELIQIIDKKQGLDWRFIDLTTEEEDDVPNQESKIKQIQEEDRNERFQLNMGNLFRVYLIQQNIDLFVLIFSLHHIILDGWSIPILFDYVHQAYLNLIEGKYQLFSLPSSFRDESYEHAQMYLQKHRLDNIDYWENEISKIEERCDFNGLLKEENKTKVLLNQYDHVKEPKSRTLIIGDNVYRNLKAACRESGLTWNSILQFVWHKVLSVYGHSSQTVIGTTVSGRNLPVNGIETSVGLFINTLPLIVNHCVDSLTIDAIRNIQDKMNEMIARSNVDFSQLSKGKMKHSLFDCLFVYENYPTLEGKVERKEKLLKFETKYSVEKLDYPLAVVAYETVANDCVTVVVNYAGELFEDDTIDDLLGLANELFTQIGNGQVTRVSDLHLLPMKQLKMINEWNDIYTNVTKLNTQTTLHQLFEVEAAKSSEKIAVVYEDVQLTYRELNEKANQLAHYLRSICDIQPDDLIALFLDKNELMIVAILGVWKSGAAYIPIDPSYPEKRIQFILEDTKAKIIISNKKYLTRMEPYEMIKIDVDSIRKITNAHNKINMSPMCSSTNLAYIIYTSGTTGQPKSVLVEHKSVISFRNDAILRYFNTDYSENSSEAILFFSSYVFDMSIEQIALSILNSNRLIILSNGYTIDEHFYNYLNENRVTYFSLTPSQLQQVDLRNLKYLKSLLVIGEPLTEVTFEKIRTQYSAKLINAYGITETTVYNTVYIYENEMKYKNSIGFPLSNTKGFVLNKNLKMLPVHAIGELYLTGDCVTRGYLNRPQLTAERFLTNPFQTNQEKKQGKNARIYKTGDLVRWLRNGELEYLGRNDLQVKIRGIRIELGEIEAVLSSYQGVNRSVVLAKDHKKKNIDAPSTKYLVGYYVSDEDIDESHIKQYIQTKLPDYMIPNRLMRIDKIPVTINGKLDAKALPDIDFSADESNYCAPRNEFEANLCEIWSHILGIEKVGITDDFFRLGGDSIDSIRIVGRVRQDLSLNISVQDIFMFKTIEKLYDKKSKVLLIERNDASQGLNAADLTDSSEETSLLPIQEYFLKRKDVSLNNFTQHVVFRIARFNEAKFKDCLVKLVAHHEAFRIRLKKDADAKYFPCYQTNLDSDQINLVRIKNASPNELNFQSELNNQLMKTADIENGPMYMVGYSYDHEDNGSAKVWIFIHDLIADWTSCRIISEDLQRLYHGGNFDSNSCYKQWSHAVKGYVNGIGTSEMEYWQSLSNASVNIFNAALAAKQLSKYDVSETEIRLTEEITKGLLNDYNKIYNTQTEHLLLTALGYTMRDEITSLTENYVMFECSVRDFVNNLDMNRSIGMFRTLYPVRLQLADEDVRSSIINIKEHVKQVPNKGIGFGAIPRNENDSLPWVLFNYLGSFENEHNENGNEDEWCLLGAFCENRMDENTQERIQINVFIINKQMRVNIKTKMGTEITVQFGKAFQINIEKIIKH